MVFVIESDDQQWDLSRNVVDLPNRIKFQMGSVYDLDYLASLHGIASLRGKVPRAGKQSAVDRKIEVEQEKHESEEEGDGE